MSEEASERTPECGGLKAIEDAGPSDGLMRPSGPPVVLGPAAVNPFWSESSKMKLFCGLYVQLTCQ